MILMDNISDTFKKSDTWKLIGYAIGIAVIAAWFAMGVKDALGIKTDRERRHQRVIEQLEKNDPSFDPEVYVPSKMRY